jgi:carbonic anhydrase
MIEMTYQIGGTARTKGRTSVSATQAQKRLERGNGRFSDLISGMRSGKPLRHVKPISPEDVGVGGSECAVQAPFAAILACSDARVPTEMVFQQGFNDLFVVRVAGNVLGTECLGSIRYATHHFSRTLRVVAVLGHANCGAVTAAVDAFLQPRRYLQAAANYPLRSIIDQIVVSVRAADMGMREVHGHQVEKHPGYRAGLLRTAVALNAAWNAYSLREELIGHASGVRVVFSVYDLGSHTLGLGPASGRSRRQRGFFEPPADADQFRTLTVELCRAVLDGA